MTSANKRLEKKISRCVTSQFCIKKRGKTSAKSLTTDGNKRIEPADEEDLRTFSLEFEFLTPVKNLKKRKKRTSKARVIVSRKTINFQTPILLSQRENTPFRDDKLKEKLLRNTRQFQQRKSDNKRRRNCASRTNCRFIQPTSKRTSHADHSCNCGNLIRKKLQVWL